MNNNAEIIEIRYNVKEMNYDLSIVISGNQRFIPIEPGCASGIVRDMNLIPQRMEKGSDYLYYSHGQD